MRMRTPIRRTASFFALCIALGGCAEDADHSDERAPSEDDPAAETTEVTTGLAIGARGKEVARLQQALASMGYFPNAELAERHPEWKPVTSAAPEPGVYDSATEAAVRAFQERMGLEASGSVDSATRDMMNAPRCGNPDSQEHDSRDKFAIYDYKWPATKRTFTYQIRDPSTCLMGSTTKCESDENCKSIGPKKCDTGRKVCLEPCFARTAPPATRAQLRDLISYALNVWSLETDFSFTQLSDSSSAKPDISVGYAEIGSTELASTSMVYRTTDKVTVSTAINFSVKQPLSAANPTPSDRYDMAAVALHEVGHALGLDHSSASHAGTPVMKPSIAPGPNEPRMLGADDRQGISARYDLWNTRPGLATDMAVGADGSVWHIGTAATGDGYRIYKWNTSTRNWDEASGNGGAYRITVAPDGTPWVATKNGSVFNHSRNVGEGGWNWVQNLCARDLSFGANGALWFVTCTPDNEGAGGGYKVGRLTAVAVTADSAVLGIQEGAGPTHALRIAVGPDGTPWIVNGYNDVYYRTSQDPNVVGWALRGGVKASDISISRDYYAFVTGAGANAGGVFIRNDQSSPYRAEWYRLANLPSGTPATIAAGSRSVWVTNSNLAMFESTAKGF